MKNHIKNYISLLDNEIKDEIQKEFNTGQKQFKSFQTFDFVNFHLIYKILLNENEKDYFISITEKEYRPNFIRSIFYSIVFVKLYQNYFNYTKTEPVLVRGDKFYINKKIYTFLCRNAENQISANILNQNNGTFTFKNKIVTKLLPDYVFNRNTFQKIENYKTFLSDIFGNDFPFLTEFKNKTLIIAEKDFNFDAFIPVRYWNRNGGTKYNLPFEPLLEICNDVNTAETYLLNGNFNFDQIIVINDSKYKEDKFNKILSAKWNLFVKNIILIGSEHPFSNQTNDNKYKFIEWLWSKDEIKIANNENPKTPQKVIIENNDLIQELGNLKDEIENIKKEINVNLSHLLIYANFYFRIILVNTSLSKGMYSEYSDRLYQYFQSDIFQQQVKNNFFGQNIYDSDIILNHTKKIFNKFKCISAILENHNLKWNYIKNKAKEVNNLYLIVEKKSFDAIENQIKNDKLDNIKLISDKRVDNEKPYIEKWINDIKNTENKTYIIPYLNNTELLDKINLLKGNCEVLCYKEIDEISFDNLLGNYYRTEKEKLTHNDRNEFVKTKFSFKEEVLQRNLDDLFKFDFESKDFKKNPYESIDIPKEKLNYEIEFTDSTFDKFESSKCVFLIDNDSKIQMNIEEAIIGMTIRYYQNNNPKLFNKILRFLDEKNLMKDIDKYSASWVASLKKIILKVGDSKVAYDKIFFNVQKKVQFNTFHQYLKGERRFPQKIKTLELIKNYCVKNELSNELLVTDFKNFDFYSSFDTSKRIEAGRVLSKDLMIYIGSNLVTKSLVLQKLKQEDLDELLNSIQEKTIKKKTLLEDE